MKLFMTLLATGRGYQSHQMPQSDIYRFMVQAYDLLVINLYGISGDELSTPWYGNTHRPSSKKKFVTVNTTKKSWQWASGIQQESFWMAVGLNFRGKIISATHYHNTLDGFRGTVQRNGLGRFNSDVTILQDNDTPHSPDDPWLKQCSGKCCSIYYKVHTCEPPSCWASLKVFSWTPIPKGQWCCCCCRDNELASCTWCWLLCFNAEISH